MIAKTSTDDVPVRSSEAATERRGFLGLAGLAGASLATLAAPAAFGAEAQAPVEAAALSSYPSRRDIAILRFLAAAELIETDLWQQYAELAQGNPRYREALEQIDDDLPVYTVDITEDELSHAEFINAYLHAIGAEPVDLDGYRVLASPPVTGLKPIGRLTNLTDLTVLTGYFRRYQSTRNPDFGASFEQIATIKDQPAIPTSNSVGDQALAGIVRVAAFHFAWVEQGGTSLYDQFVPYVTSREVLRIVSSIYATEAVHYAIFRDSLNGITAFHSGDGKLVVPDLTEGRQGSSHVFPKRCRFLSDQLPTCSVIRPSSTKLAGAQATVTALAASNLFKGQPPAFLQTLTALAKAADGVA
ncbi:MAG: ferritin-like domain-containing protein [Geminicoccaceae bacterium]